VLLYPVLVEYIPALPGRHPLCAPYLPRTSAYRRSVRLAILGRVSVALLQQLSQNRLWYPTNHLSFDLVNGPSLYRINLHFASVPSVPQPVRFTVWSFGRLVE
jgi:hypothetical protein